eukprot:COSAG02_NODE_18852_length_914_cov_1.024540_1_plen_28_part_10
MQEHCRRTGSLRGLLESLGASPSPRATN